MLQLVSLFAIKVVAGIAYAKFYTLPKYFPGSDTWRFYRYSLEETKWLLRSPLQFVTDLFVHGYSKTGNLFSGENSYWNDLKSNVIIKFLAVANVFTNNSYYADIILFNFFFLFGQVALCKLFFDLFPNKKSLIIAGIFLLPSTLFWCSGIHKDGFILSATGMIIYAYRQVLKNGVSLKRAGVILICVIVIFALRNYVVFALLPAMIAWFLTSRHPGITSKIFATTYIVCTAFFFLTPHIFSSVNLPYYIVSKQQEFLLLQGGSEVLSGELQASVSGFISFLPHALDMAFLRPHITEMKNLSYLPAAIEVILLLILVILCLIHGFNKVEIKPVIWVLFAFSISILLLCGYTIPFTGAIVRYRSLVLPLLITPLLCVSDFSSLNFFQKKLS